MKLLLIFVQKIIEQMDKLFDIIFLDEAFEFLCSLNKKHYEKILLNIRKAQNEHNSELFKKLKDEIWEFRTLYQGLQYRLLAFWDKTNSENTLVVSTHVFIKKRSNIPDNEIQKAKQLRVKYFENKEKLKKKLKKMKTYTLEEVQDKLIGKIGTRNRDKFEFELQMNLIGKAIKQTRNERNLTQEELGKLIGVQKAQISRIESNASNVTIDTLLRVFRALQAKVKFQVELPHLKISLGQ